MQVLRISEVCQRLGVSRTTLWRLEKAGEFVPKVRIGLGVVGYIERDVDAWLTGRSAPPPDKRRDV